MYETTIAIDDFEEYLKTFPEDAPHLENVEEVIFTIKYEVYTGYYLLDEITGWETNISEILLKNGIRCYPKQESLELHREIESWISSNELEAKLWEAYDEGRKDKEEYRASVECDFRD